MDDGIEGMADAVAVGAFVTLDAVDGVLVNELGLAVGCAFQRDIP